MAAKATCSTKWVAGAILFLLLGFSAGCGKGSSSSSGILTVTVSPGSAVVALGGTQTFTATVTNDSKNQGVTWTLSQFGEACSPACGSISPTTSASGAAATYTAPGTALTLTLTATSVTQTTIAYSVTITTTGTTAVSVSPTSATVGLNVSGATNDTQQFVATVANDTSNKGVNWTLTQSGVACSPGCGSVSPTSTADGVATTYTAPSTAPSSNTVVTLTATSVAFPGETAWATITISGGLTVSVSPSYVANVPEGGTQAFTATVTNDSSNKGVTWNLSQNGSSCSASACGTISPTTTASGAATTYTAPALATTVTLTATSVAQTSIAAYATIVTQPITVQVFPSTAVLYATQTTTFSALVTNDIKNGGVKWTLTQNGAACSASCGTLSPTTTGSGVNTTYTAPNAISSAATVTLTATSVTDNTKSATASISLYPPIGVAVSPSSATVPAGNRTTFTATVTNDPTNAGAQWELTQGGNACSPGCGAVSPANTASGQATTYFAPSTVPSNATVTLSALSSAQVTASGSATITISSSAAAARFAGSYAFAFDGYDASGPVAIAGRFTADAAGNVTGIDDATRASGVSTAEPFSGSYTVSAGGQGSLALESAPEGAALGTFRFALNQSESEAQFTETDNSGTRGTGIFQKQTVAAFTPAALAGAYSFGLAGTGLEGERVALAGTFQADAAGAIRSGQLDWNDGGNVAPAASVAGSYTLDTAGRGTLALRGPEGVLHWAFYPVSAGEWFLVSTDPRQAEPWSSGRALAQAAADAGAFSTASLSGASVIRMAGASAGGGQQAASQGSQVAAGLVTFDGMGRLEYSLDENNAGRVETRSGAGSYTVAPDGRAAIVLDSAAAPLVAYLVGRNRAVVVGSGAGASSGELYPQAAGLFSNATLSGDFAFRTLAAPAGGDVLEWGTASSGGDGQLAGSVRIANPGGGNPAAQSFSQPYAVSASGRGTLGAAGSSVLYFLSPSRAVVIDMTPGESNPTLTELLRVQHFREPRP